MHTTPSPTTRRHPVLRALAWGATFVAFPLGGLLATSVVGAVDDVGAALVGGAIVGAVVGLSQALASRALLPGSALPIGRWVAATTVGMGIGLAGGAVLVDFATSVPALAVMGTVTGAVLGVAQGLALPRSLATGLLARMMWAAATSAVMAIGWTVTALAGVSVERQFAVFGATGALVATALIGVNLWALSRRAGSAAVVAAVNP